DRALETLRNVAELSPQDPSSRAIMAEVYVRKNQPQLAQEQARSSIQLSNNDDSIVASAAWVFAATGKKDEARRMLEQLKQSPDPDPYLVATAYGALGDKDAAFRLLDEAYAKRNSSLVDIGCEPAFEDLHSDPRYQALLLRMGLAQ
ncbi:MAG: tetratricopeptide repeat protein, partial [Candidatus Korobacteraceae bacterium]